MIIISNMFHFLSAEILIDWFVYLFPACELSKDTKLNNSRFMTSLPVLLSLCLCFIIKFLFLASGLKWIVSVLHFILLWRSSCSSTFEPDSWSLIGPLVSPVNHSCPPPRSHQGPLSWQRSSDWTTTTSRFQDDTLDFLLLFWRLKPDDIKQQN